MKEYVLNGIKEKKFDMLSSRRYFRYDVIVPMHLEPVDRYGKQQNLTRRHLIGYEEEARLQEINEALEQLFQTIAATRPAALHVFEMLNKRLEFMWWMLDFIIESEDPHIQYDYKLRMKEDAELRRPTHKKSSSIAPLILGLYDALEDYIFELNEVIQNSVKNNGFHYSKRSQRRFDDKHYVTNLEDLAASGVLPASVLQLMVEKINLQATVLERLKEAYRKTSSPEDWKSYQVNLSPIGCSFLTDDDYPIFEKMNVYMRIQNDVIICRGKVSSQESVENELLNFRVHIEFELLTGEQEHSITLFTQLNELRDSMETVPVPYIPPFNA